MKNTFDKGFTLLEVLMYTAIMSIMFTGILLFSFGLITSGDRIRSNIELSENARFVRQKMQWATKAIANVNYPAQNESGDTLSLDFDDQLGFTDEYVFRLNSTSLQMQSNGLWNDITNDSIVVSSVSFSHYFFSYNTRATIRVQALLRSSDERFPATTSLDFFVTVQ